MENYYYYFLKGILFYYFFKFYFMLLHCFPLNLNELKLSKRKKPVCPCALASLQVFGSLGWLVVIM